MSTAHHKPYNSVYGTSQAIKQCLYDTTTTPNIVSPVSKFTDSKQQAARVFINTATPALLH
jgi:hypothetical protein